VPFTSWARDAITRTSDPTFAIAAIVTPFVGLCFGLHDFAAGLYVFVLGVMGVKGVNQCGWGQAIGSLLLPVLGVACRISVGIAGLLSMPGPQATDIFNSILTPVP